MSLAKEGRKNKAYMVDNQRLKYIDLGAGIMILYMVIGHVLLFAWGLDTSCGEKSISESPRTFFPYLSFFMPYFFYKSGMFFKKKPIQQLLSRDSKKLLLNYFLWGGIGFVLFVIMRLIDGTATLHNCTYSVLRTIFLRGTPPNNEALWFLLTLFGVRFLANVLLPSDDQRDKWQFYLRCSSVIVLGYIISFLSHTYSHDTWPWWIANGAAGLAFFCAGYMLREYGMKKWMIYPCLFVYLICCIVGFPYVGMLDNKLLTGNYLLWVPVSVCCIIAFNYICVVLVKMQEYILEKYNLKSYLLRFFENIGICAMPIYVSHYLILQCYSYVISHNQFNYPHTIVLTILEFGLIMAIIITHQYKKSKI